ncbi:MAG: hypothetical protein PHE83_02330 [Opitutaceae bacterium]|nr:hypothetical protein [Opitutaceae bacterium]
MQVINEISIAAVPDDPSAFAAVQTTLTDSPERRRETSVQAGQPAERDIIRGEQAAEFVELLPRTQAGR